MVGWKRRSRFHPLCADMHAPSTVCERLPPPPPIDPVQGILMDLSTLTALTWVALIVAAALTGLAKSNVPGLASIAAALFALMLPAKESTGVMLVFLPIADVIALWAYRRDANTAVLRRLMPSVLAGMGLGHSCWRSARRRRCTVIRRDPPVPHRSTGPVALACAWAGAA